MHRLLTCCMSPALHPSMQGCAALKDGPACSCRHSPAEYGQHAWLVLTAWPAHAQMEQLETGSRGVPCPICRVGMLTEHAGVVLCPRGDLRLDLRMEGLTLEDVPCERRALPPPSRAGVAVCHVHDVGACKQVACRPFRLRPLSNKRA